MTYYYTYYSYEEWGRGYIGSRPSGCECDPQDDPYMGSFRDLSFHPTRKIILGVYSSAEECLQAEIDLHNFFQVDVNPHFANKAKQTSTGFLYNRSGETLTCEHKEKIKTSHKRPHQGQRKFTDGVNDFFAEECPPGCKPGIGLKHRQSRDKIPKDRLRVGGATVKGTRWWNNGIQQRRASSCPGDGWNLGRLPWR
jgi:hypothetical protein